MQSSFLVLAGHWPHSESHFPITVYTIRNPWSFATVLKAQKDIMWRFLASLQKLDSTVNATVFCHTVYFPGSVFFPIHFFYLNLCLRVWQRLPCVVANNFYLCCQNSFCAKLYFTFFHKVVLYFLIKNKVSYVLLSLS